MNKKGIIIGLILAVALGGGFLYRFTNIKNGSGEQAEKKEPGQKEEKAGGQDKGTEKKEGQEGDKNPGSVKMTAEMQKQNGVIVASAKKQRLGGVISATGKVEANADRIAHVSPRISGKIVSVRASLGDSVSAGQPLATLDWARASFVFDWW